jgi:ABC-type multidrug transport system ATPase subunit
VLRGVDVTLDRGAVVAVRGANGSGKSTLLRLLAGVTVPSRGRRVAARPAVGYAPDVLEPAPPFRARGWLRRHAAMRGIGAADGEREVTALADRLGATALLDDPLGALSKGSLAKVVAIQALLGDPDLVVLDEPFAGLDPDARESLAVLMHERAHGGAAVVFSDHGAAPAPVTWTLAEGTVR